MTDIELGACNPLNGSCSLPSIKYLKSLEAIRMQNEIRGEQCFFEAVAYHFVQSSERKKLKKFIKRNMNCSISTPVSPRDIAKFERDNPKLKMRINLLYSEDGEIFPHTISKIKIGKEVENNINLLLYNTSVDGEVIMHYSYVEDIDVLLRRTYKRETEEGVKISYEKSVHCPNCLLKFVSPTLSKEHEEVCLKNDPIKIVVPEEGEVTKFKKFERKFKRPFIAFFDFEAIQQAPDRACEICPDNLCVHAGETIAVQKPITYALIVIETEGNRVIHKNCYTGEDAASHLIDTLISIEKGLLRRMRRYPTKQLTPLEEKKFQKSVICHICELPLDGDSVRDHDHATNRYLGSAHQLCNLNRCVDESIPVYAHNLQGYDSHFIISALKKNKDLWRLEGLPLNTQNFRTLQINSFHFVDSLSFLNAPLAELVNNLTKNKRNKFDILDQMDLYKREEKRKKKLLLRKGVCPYESLKNYDMLKTTKQLPPHDAFHSSLSDSNITDEEYLHGQKVFREFRCKNLLQYLEIYCYTDVALLAEVMLEFRHVVYSDFGIDCW